MAGYTTSSSSKIWMLVKKAKKISVTIIEKSSQKEIMTLEASSDSLLKYKSQTPVILFFTDLKPETEYQLKILLDNVLSKNNFLVKTLPDVTVKDFTFLLGSCAMVFPKWLWPFYPQNKGNIFVPMRNFQADFMLWLGDNVYYRGREQRSINGMFHRHLVERKRKRMRDFLKSMPQYAIWDDHDFGPNDSEGSFPLKENSCTIQKNFWPNPDYGSQKGVYTHFRYFDAEFILTDNRFYRTMPEDSNPTLLGEDQLVWMFNILKNSDATFKFIVTGSQVLNEKNLNESHSHFPAERQRIFDFIRDNKISGVVFLTGDRHHSELLKMNIPNSYPLFDFTCSPLSGLARHTTKTHEATNPLRVENTLVTEHNFGKISITGTQGNRICLIQTFDENANIKWEYKIPETDLKK